MTDREAEAVTLQSFNTIPRSFVFPDPSQMQIATRQSRERGILVHPADTVNRLMFLPFSNILSKTPVVLITHSWSLLMVVVLLLLLLLILLLVRVLHLEDVLRRVAQVKL